MNNQYKGKLGEDLTVDFSDGHKELFREGKWIHIDKVGSSYQGHFKSIETGVDEVIYFREEFFSEIKGFPVDKSKAQQRKEMPIYSGVLQYFPNAIREVAKTSFVGNEQHHPGTKLHWDMSKSADEQDAMIRHLMDHSANPMDDDGCLHLAKVCWRALAGLERYLTDKEH